MYTAWVGIFSTICRQEQERRIIQRGTDVARKTGKDEPVRIKAYPDDAVHRLVLLG